MRSRTGGTEHRLNSSFIHSTGHTLLGGCTLLGGGHSPRALPKGCTGVTPPPQGTALTPHIAPYPFP